MEFYAEKSASKIFIISKKHFQKVSAIDFASSKYIQCVPKVCSSTLKVCNVTYDCTRVTFESFKQKLSISV